MTPTLTVRRGGPADAGWLLGLFDEAIAWMVARGQPGQWGTELMSHRARGRDRVAEFCAGGGLRIGAVDGEDAAALVVGDRPEHVEAAGRPELYIELLLVAHGHAGRGLGAWLVDCALAEARAGGLDLVRVDCWAGAPSLVAWYESCGFHRAGTFTVHPRGKQWIGQVLSRDLAAAGPVVSDVQPELWVEPAPEAIDFYVAAFGARVLHRVGAGEDVVAQLGVGATAFWVATAAPDAGRLSPRALGGATGRTLLVVADPDAVQARALAAGATELAPVADEHGWRIGRVRDPFGHEWELGRPGGVWPPPRP